MLRCAKKDCGVTEESKLQEHHLKPKFLGGTDRDGRVHLCKPHHDQLHQLQATACVKIAREWLEL